MCVFLLSVSKKSAKSKAEAQSQKKQELERRLKDVSGQLGGSYAKKDTKKGKGEFVVVHSVVSEGQGLG